LIIDGGRQSGEDSGARAGTQALTLLATPINVYVLQALAEKSKSLMDLRREIGSPPQTTMRGYLRTLDETGVLTRRRQEGFPGSLDFELAPPGRDLLLVTEALRSWLAEAPEGPLEPGTSAAKSAVKALIGGWSTNMMRALAARPLSLTELDSLISGISYPTLERRLSAMRLSGQIEAVSSPGKGTPYGVTEWLRRAIAPLAAAAQWERRHLRATAAPITGREVEAAFLLAVPLLRLPAGLSGFCRMAVELPANGSSRIAGVLIGVEEGRIASCVSRLEGDASAWAAGSASVWLRALIEQDATALETGGDSHLTGALIDGMHDELFGLAATR
jgi:DNA-binding HxlR family transcriptional regulator